MDANSSETNEKQVSLRPVDQDNWRDVVRLKVSEAQQDFVAEPSYYLALCAYGNDWQPLAITLGEQVIGFMMWATDEADGSCWLGGIIIDQGMQNRSYGSQAVQAAIKLMNEQHGYTNFALSYQPTNLAGKHVYAKLGFVEMDEWEDDEVVARYSLRE
jgi:diamine N-acetyltransferase